MCLLSLTVCIVLLVVLRQLVDTAHTNKHSKSCLGTYLCRYNKPLMTKYQRAEDACQEQQRQIEAALASRRINKVRLGWCVEPCWQPMSPMLLWHTTAPLPPTARQVLQDGHLTCRRPCGRLQ